MNVIPGRCELSLDVRAPDDSTRLAAYDDIVAECARIAARRNVTVSVRKVLDVSCAPCSAALQRRIAESICRVTGTAEARHLPSGAGHDAMMMASLTEIGMLFVRCGNGGISHHPDESLDENDADLAGRVLMDFLLNYAERHSPWLKPTTHSSQHMSMSISTRSARSWPSWSRCPPTIRRAIAQAHAEKARTLLQESGLHGGKSSGSARRGECGGYAQRDELDRARAFRHAAAHA